MSDSFDTGRGTRILGGIEYAIPGTGNACGAANDCCRVRGHEGDHINASGFRWGPNGTSRGDSWIDLFEREQHDAG